MRRDYYDEMIIGQARAKRARAAWIDRCAMALGRLGLPGAPEQLGEVAAGFHNATPASAPDEAARDCAAVRR